MEQLTKLIHAVLHVSRGFGTQHVHYTQSSFVKYLHQQRKLCHLYDRAFEIRKADF